MEYTQNLNLPQFAESDRIMHDDFNDAFDKLDAAISGKSGIVFGSYTGDDTAERTITLDFTPSAVYVVANFGSAMDSRGFFYGGLALTDKPSVVQTDPSANVVEIVTGGFRVFRYGSNNYAVLSNEAGREYYYAALR